MREIKFRAWDEEEKCIIEWNDTFFSDMSAVTMYQSYFSDIEMPLMQYIGRKDKNGKEIYEDDIVDVVMLEGVCNPSTKYLVEYHNTGFYLKCKNIDDDIGYVEICGYECCIKSMEIIGNIHENPELLEEK